MEAAAQHSRSPTRRSPTRRAARARRWMGVALASAALLGGCAWMPPTANGLSAALDPPPVAECRSWLAQLDATVAAHAVRDGAAARLPGRPFLRVNRLLASFGAEAAQSEAGWQAWGGRLLALDAEARTAELRNLPPWALPALGVPTGADGLARVKRCGEALWAALSADPAQRQALLAEAKVPDDYHPLLRTLGLYPVTQWPFYAGVQRELRLWQARWDAAAREPVPAGGWRRYRPDSEPLAADALAALLRGVPRDALGLPLPDDASAQRLLAAYAPTLDIADSGPHDRPGRLGWGADARPQVDTREPVVYQRIAHTRWQGETRLQLVYSVWFTERPPRGPLDLLAGPVDGVLLRLTLDAAGRVLLLDSIHACGCYHVFVPAAGLRPLPPQAPRREWAFVPSYLPAYLPAHRPTGLATDPPTERFPAPLMHQPAHQPANQPARPSGDAMEALPLLPAGQRLRLRLTAGDHQLVAVAADMAADTAADTPAPAGVPVQTYRLENDDALRSLTTPDGGRRGLFQSNGLMPGTERGERLLFWPMGIASPGTMRQWGRQPTAFVGRRHFDDPWLLEQRFAPGTTAPTH